MNGPMGPLLRDLAAEVPEPDLADRTWAEGRRVARRRHTVAGGVALAAAAGVLAVVATHLGSAPSAAPMPGREGPTAAYRPAHLTVDGTTVDLAPTPNQERALPLLPNVADVALPNRLGFAADVVLPRISDLGGVSGSVRAVLLRHDGSGGYTPVLYVPGRSRGAYVEVDPVHLGPLTNADGFRFAYLGPTTIAADRHRLAFVQDGSVVVLDAADGSVRTFPVPGHLLSGGWARDDRSVVVGGTGGTWRVDTVTGTVSRVGGAAFPGWARLVSTASRGPALETARADGTRADSREVPPAADGWWGEPVTNLEGWTVSGAFYPAAVQDVAATYQGLYAVQFDAKAHARLLAAPDVPGVPKGAFVARGWAPQDVVLFTSSSFVETGSAVTTRLLAWDVIDGRMWRVSAIGPVDPSVGGFTGDVALSP